MLQWDRGSIVVKVLCYNGTAVAQWLRCCATNRKIAGSIPAGVSGFLIDISPTYRTMDLGSTQPLTEMSTRSSSWGVKVSGASCWTIILLIAVNQYQKL